MATNGKVSVKVRNGNLDSAIKFFRRQVMNSGHLQEYKDRQEYIKPSVRNRRKKQEAVWNQKKKTRNDKSSRV